MRCGTPVPRRAFLEKEACRVRCGTLVSESQMAVCATPVPRRGSCHALPGPARPGSPRGTQIPRSISLMFEACHVGCGISLSASMIARGGNPGPALGCCPARSGSAWPAKRCGTRVLRRTFLDVEACRVQCGTPLSEWKIAGCETPVPRCGFWPSLVRLGFPSRGMWDPGHASHIPRSLGLPRAM